MATAEVPRVAVVGAGRHATARIYPYLDAAGFELAGVADLDRAKAEANAARFGGRAYTDFRRTIEAEGPDAAIVCVGPETHAELAVEIVGRGIPVYTEKPPAPSAREALAVARAAAAAGVLCATGFKKRYAAGYARASEFISEFPAGRLSSISMDRSSGPYSNDSPRMLFLLDSAIHMIDLSGYLFGDADSVFAFSKGLDAYAVSLRYANGAVGSMSFTTGRDFRTPSEEVEISIDGGNFMTVHNVSNWRITREGRCVEWREPPTFVVGADPNEAGELAELRDFAEAVAEGRGTSRSSVYESYKTMVLYEAISESARTGEPVRPAYEGV